MNRTSLQVTYFSNIFLIWWPILMHIIGSKTSMLSVGRFFRAFSWPQSATFTHDWKFEHVHEANRCLVLLNSRDDKTIFNFLFTHELRIVKWSNLGKTNQDFLWKYGNKLILATTTSVMFKTRVILLLKFNIYPRWIAQSGLFAWYCGLCHFWATTSSNFFNYATWFVVTIAS